MDLARYQDASPFPPSENDALHRRLAAFNRRRFAPTIETRGWEAELEEEHQMRVQEGRFVERERARVSRHLANIPWDPDEFIAWFEALEENGPGQRDPLLLWLAKGASLGQMTWFLAHEVSGEQGLEDLIALTQLQLPPEAKLGLARNYWEEMGGGDAQVVHASLLQDLLRSLGIVPSMEHPWESLALDNLMVALAANRRYAYQSIGALGAVELTTSVRAKRLNEGLVRLNVSQEGRRYYALHATVDQWHADAWKRDVLRPLVAEHPELALPIGEGALMRLHANARCLERFHRMLLA